MSATRASACSNALLGIAIGELANRDLVGLGLRDEQWRRCRMRPADRSPPRAARSRCAPGRPHPPRDNAYRRRRSDRLADVANALDRERPLVYRRLERDQERVGQRPHVLAGHDSPDAVLRQRRARIDADNLGVRMRGANDVSVQRPRRNRQVIGISSGPDNRAGSSLRRIGTPRNWDTTHLNLETRSYEDLQPGWSQTRPRVHACSAARGYDCRSR